jgi:hypothetical protein
MRDGRSEECEQGVSGELVDVALVLADDVREAFDDRIDDLEKLFGVESIGEGSESREVREQCGDQASLFGDLATGCDQVVRDLLGDEALEGLGNIGLGGGTGLLGCRRRRER